jgi:transposase-like protein
LPGNWASRLRCCAIGVIAAQNGIRGQRCTRHRRRSHLLIERPDRAAEIAQLRRENDRLRRERDMERDILKKAVAIFSEAPR